MSEPFSGRHVVVRGSVQGVAYRYSTVREASRLPVAGWVRNAPDGSVEAVVEGPVWAVDELVEWMAEGPPGAVVESIDVVEQSPEGHAGFVIAR